MVDLKEIYSLTEFQRNAKEHIKRLKMTGQVHVLTVNGKAEVVVQDTDSYQELMDLLERAQAIVGIRQGLASMKRGDGRPAAEALDAIRKRLRVPHDK